MARWKLTDAHYLNVPGTEWEYKESDRETGRQARKIFEVPLHLDPKNPADWTDRSEEAIIVSNRFDKAHPRDHVFIGPPTPDMEPLDDEAQRITDELRNSGAWIHPIDSLNMTYSQSVLSDFERQLAVLLAGAKQASPSTPNLSLGGVSQESFEKLQEQVAALMERNAKLEEALLEKRTAGRRV